MDEINLKQSESSDNLNNYINQMDSDYYKEILQNDNSDNDKVNAFQILNDIRKNVLVDTIKTNLKPISVGFFFTLLVCFVALQMFCFAKSIYYIDDGYLINSLLILCFAIISVPVFIFSTAFKFWNFHKQKLTFLFFNILNFALLLTTILFRIFYFILAPLLLKINTDYIEPQMIVFLGRTLLFIFTVLTIFFILKFLIKIIYEENTKREILNFKVTMYVDTRKDKKFAYDLLIVQYMKDGSVFVIKEVDRFIHTLTTGTTGTGKSSSALLLQIVGDLNKKVLNEDTQKKILKHMLEKDKVYIDQPFNDIDFNINYFHPKLGYEDEFNKLLHSYKSCGLTVIAPNSDLTDKVFNLSKARGIKCNRIDPMLVEGKNIKKQGFIGFNPLYISPSIPEWDRNREIIKKATLFSDILQSLNEMKGKGDPYFMGINRSVTTAITILLEKTFPILNGGKQPNPGHVQYLINDFSRINKYFDEFNKLPDREEFEFVRDFIRTDLIGSGKDKMNDQIRGLRTILNEFLTNPLIRDVLCAEKTVDMDKMLANGEVTVLNYALELGATDSVAFGLFFVLSFNDAVLRRPGTESSRLPNFFIIDELPVLLHPQMERCFSLFRQYRVAMTVAIQSLDQMDRSELTKYLKGVIIGNCAHHIVFGRSSTTEMKLYSELAGKKASFTSQSSVSQTSLTTENPSYSYSERVAPTEVNVLEPADVRNRGFQEVTVFSVVNGSSITPFYGRVSFLKKSEYRTKKRYRVKWVNYYTSQVNKVSTINDSVVNQNEILFTSEGTIEKVNFKDKASILFTESNAASKEKPLNIDNKTLINSNSMNVLELESDHKEKVEDGEEERDNGVSIF